MRDTICPEVSCVTSSLVIVLSYLSWYEYLVGDLFSSIPSVGLKPFQNILDEGLGSRD